MDDGQPFWLPLIKGDGEPLEQAPDSPLLLDSGREFRTMSFRPQPLSMTDSMDDSSMDTKQIALSKIILGRVEPNKVTGNEVLRDLQKSIVCEATEEISPKVFMPEVKSMIQSLLLQEPSNQETPQLQSQEFQRRQGQQPTASASMMKRLLNEKIKIKGSRLSLHESTIMSNQGRPMSSTRQQRNQMSIVTASTMVPNLSPLRGGWQESSSSSQFRDYVSLAGEGVGGGQSVASEYGSPLSLGTPDQMLSPKFPSSPKFTKHHPFKCSTSFSRLEKLEKLENRISGGVLGTSIDYSQGAKHDSIVRKHTEASKRKTLSAYMTPAGVVVMQRGMEHLQQQQKSIGVLGEEKNLSADGDSDFLAPSSSYSHQGDDDYHSYTGATPMHVALAHPSRPMSVKQFHSSPLVVQVTTFKRGDQQRGTMSQERFIVPGKWDQSSIEDGDATAAAAFFAQSSRISQPFSADNLTQLEFSRIEAPIVPPPPEQPSGGSLLPCGSSLFSVIIAAAGVGRSSFISSVGGTGTGLTSSYAAPAGDSSSSQVVVINSSEAPAAVANGGGGSMTPFGHAMESKFRERYRRNIPSAGGVQRPRGSAQRQPRVSDALLVQQQQLGVPPTSGVTAAGVGVGGHNIVGGYDVNLLVPSKAAPPAARGAEVGAGPMRRSTVVVSPKRALESPPPKRPPNVSDTIAMDIANRATSLPDGLRVVTDNNNYVFNSEEVTIRAAARRGPREEGQRQKVEDDKEEEELQQQKRSNNRGPGPRILDVYEDDEDAILGIQNDDDGADGDDDKNLNVDDRVLSLPRAARPATATATAASRRNGSGNGSGSGSGSTHAIRIPSAAAAASVRGSSTMLATTTGTSTTTSTSTFIADSIPLLLMSAPSSPLSHSIQVKAHTMEPVAYDDDDVTASRSRSIGKSAAAAVARGSLAVRRLSSPTKTTAISYKQQQQQHESDINNDDTDTAAIATAAAAPIIGELTSAYIGSVRASIQTPILPITGAARTARVGSAAALMRRRSSTATTTIRGGSGREAHPMQQQQRGSGGYMSPTVSGTTGSGAYRMRDISTTASPNRYHDYSHYKPRPHSSTTSSSTRPKSGGAFAISAGDGIKKVAHSNGGLLLPVAMSTIAGGTTGIGNTTGSTDMSYEEIISTFNVGPRHETTMPPPHQQQHPASTVMSSSMSSIMKRGGGAAVQSSSIRRDDDQYFRGEGSERMVMSEDVINPPGTMAQYSQLRKGSPPQQIDTTSPSVWYSSSSAIIQQYQYTYQETPPPTTTTAAASTTTTATNNNNNNNITTAEKAATTRYITSNNRPQTAGPRTTSRRSVL